MIKYVINGFYRSGTTFLYRSMKEIKYDHVILYEPFHKNLEKFVDKEKKSKKYDKLHKSLLWEGYNNIPENELQKAYRNLPKNVMEGLDKENKVFIYLNIYHKCDLKIILQVNRLHFYLDKISKRYEAKTVHIIRNPFDVYNSLLNLYIKLNYKLIFRLINICLRNTNPFDISNVYKKIFLKKSKYDFFHKMFSVWLLTNYFACKNIDKDPHMGRIILYENFLDEIYNISNFLELKFEDYEIIKNKFHLQNYQKINEKYKIKILQIIEKESLMKEWEYIKNLYNSKGVCDYVFDI